MTAETRKELEALREEIARLRERVAVLEAQPKTYPAPVFPAYPPAIGQWQVVTCDGVAQ